MSAEQDRKRAERLAEERYPLGYSHKDRLEAQRRRSDFIAGYLARVEDEKNEQ